MHLREDNTTIRIGNGIGDILEREIHDAKRRLWIVSPWISERYAILLAKKCDSGVDVRLITTNDYTNRGHARALRALSQRKDHLISLALVSIGFAILFREPLGMLVAVALVIVHFLHRRDKIMVRLTIKNKAANLVHSKIYVVDSKAMISSANLTYSGLKKNYEALVIFEKESVVESIAKTYEELER